MKNSDTPGRLAGSTRPNHRRQRPAHSQRHAIAWLLFLFACMCGTAAHATRVAYTLGALGGAQYRYDYLIAAEPGDAAIREFAIYFDTAVTSALTASTAPAGWDTVLLQPDPALLSDGVFDSATGSTGIGAGVLLGGFSVTLTFDGPGTPGAQRFEIIDPDTFTLVSSGMTSATGIPPVPEPDGRLLLVAGLCSTVLLRRVARAVTARTGRAAT